MNFRVFISIVAFFLPLVTQAALRPTFSGHDTSRNQIQIDLIPVVQELDQPVDIQFLPSKNGSSRPDIMIVLEKRGKLRWFSLRGKETGTLLELDVLTRSEQGLLGLAFHPRFTQNRKFYLNYSIQSRGKRVTRISEWTLPLSWESLPFARKPVKAHSERILLEVEQPYANHNAGQLQFGPDGYLYIGMGDGGAANDPHGHGQNAGTLLGSMLRIDVDKRTRGKPYGIPKDNPFLGKKGALPEIWAIGLRNPWRYSFAPDGRLLVADVGQNLWEEISVVRAGGNYGWKIKESFHCFQNNAKCSSARPVDPILEYDRSDGVSITGGYVYSGTSFPELKGKYLFGDFGTGRIWAAELPKKGAKKGALKKTIPFIALGKWPLSISTFGKDQRGRVYVADFARGKIYRIQSPKRRVKKGS